MAEVRGFPVPGARDLRLSDLVPVEHERPDGREETPFRNVYIRKADLTYPELRWVEQEDFPRHLVVARGRTYLAVPRRVWNRHAADVVGMRAPELGNGFERALAVSERQLQVWNAARAEAARRRGRLLLHGRRNLGVSLAHLAQWIGVTRGCVQQLLREAEDGESPRDAAPLPTARSELRHALHEAQELLEERVAFVERARRLRKRHVARAFGFGHTTAEVADVLGVSRARAHQLGRPVT